jgi:hypothetical protein
MSTRNLKRVRAFRRATNISLNAASSTVSNYLVSPCAIGAFERITTRLFERDGQRAWTITGPYGTGKSSFAAFLAAVLAGKAHPGHASMLAALEAVAPKSARLIRANMRAKGRLVPVLATGSRESIGRVLSKACIRTIDQYCTSTAARKFKGCLSSDLAKGREILPLELVRSMHELVVSHEENVAGTVIIIDELGKLLEFAARHPDRADVFSLQQIAELASVSTGSLNIIGILHQDFAAYARDLAPEEKLEWEKIRGRFEDVLFDEPADQMLRMLARAIQSDGPAGAAKREWDDAVTSVTNAKALPSGLPNSETVGLLKRCWPLHPLTAIILGSVFKRYGQNERSAFTFVQSHEPFSLRDFSDRHDGQMYLLADLFEYLMSTYGDGLVANRDGKHWAEAINIERRLSEAEPAHVKTFRTTALLGVIGRWGEVGPTPTLVEAALTPVYSRSVVKEAVEALRNKSLLVVRKFNNTLALWEGSDVDIEGRLALARATIPRSITSATELSRYMRTRPLIARRHSFETGTLRVFPVTFAGTDRDPSVSPEPGKGDGQINVMLMMDGTSNDPSWIIRLSKTSPSDLFVVPGNSRDVLSLVQELACLEWVRRNTPELAGDVTARRELDAREGEVRRRLATEQSEMLFGEDPGAAVKWYRNGKPVRVRDARELNDFLSTVCDELFPSAPVIRNEIINRSELSSSAAAARRNLIQLMIEGPNVDGLGITGNPPERSVYLSVLRELGLHRASHDGHSFSADPTHARNNGRKMLEGIHRFFESTEAERRTVAELFAVLKGRPYGVRAGVLPVILCAVLLASESEIALYEDGAFVPLLSIEVFERLMKTPSQFSVRRWTVTGVRAAIFGQMAGLLGSASEIRVGRDQVLNVVKPLLRFYRRLDQYSQTTRSISQPAMFVRDALSAATEPDQLLFVELPKACGVEPFGADSRGRDQDAKKYVVRLRENISELQRAYDSLLQSLKNAVAEAFGLSQNLSELRKRLTERAHAVESVAVDPEMKAFVRRLNDGAVEDRQWLESLASLLAGRPTAVWHDEDRSRFAVVLSTRVRRFQSLEAMLRNGSHAVKNGEQVVRLAVAGSALRDYEVVVHLSREQAVETLTLVDQIRTLIGPERTSRQRNVVLASLASLIEETAGEPQLLSHTGA